MFTSLAAYNASYSNAPPQNLAGIPTNFALALVFCDAVPENKLKVRYY